MKFSICIDALFDGWSPAQALEGVETAGFHAFEFWGWRSRDIDSLSREAGRRKLRSHAFCTLKVSLVDSRQRRAWLTGLSDTLAVAARLGTQTIITQVGDQLPDVPRQAQRESLVAGLRAGVPLLREAGATLVFEPLNTAIDHAGYYLASSDEAFSIAEEVGSDRVKVLFDIYHQQVTEGNLLDRIRGHLGLIGHFHAAGVPGRHELDGGELDYRVIFRAIDAAGWEGCIGLEYFPVGDPVAGLQPWAAFAGGT